jgi:AcrR family transcriptional regulator
VCGISLSGLYYYIESKDEILYLIQDRSFGTLIEDLEELLAGASDPMQRLHLFVENHLHFFVANMKEMKVLSHEAGSLEGEYRRLVNQKKRRYTELCMEIIEGLDPKGSSINPRVAVFSLFGMLNWIYNWYRPDRDIPVGELADEMTRLFLRGFSGESIPELERAWVGGEADPPIWGS